MIAKRDTQINRACARACLMLGAAIGIFVKFTFLIFLLTCATARLLLAQGVDAGVRAPTNGAIQGWVIPRNILIEIQGTSLAQQLTKLGFEDKRNGLFEKRGVPLDQFLHWFSLSEKDLMPVPSVAFNEWVRRTRIEGNHTILKRTIAWGEHATTNMPIDVVVNLEYARPEALFTGMPEERLSAALSLIGARPAPSLVAEGTNAESKLRFILPDGQGLEVGVRQGSKLGGKPMLLKVNDPTVGEKGRGFEAWGQQMTQTTNAVKINQYRQGYR